MAKKHKYNSLKLQKAIAINLRTMNLGLFSKNKLSLHKLQNL